MRRSDISGEARLDPARILWDSWEELTEGELHKSKNGSIIRALPGFTTSVAGRTVGAHDTDPKDDKLDGGLKICRARLLSFSILQRLIVRRCDGTASRGIHGLRPIVTRQNPSWAMIAKTHDTAAQRSQTREQLFAPSPWGCFLV
jgi:hypothetical protein